LKSKSRIILPGNMLIRTPNLFFLFFLFISQDLRHVGWGLIGLYVVQNGALLTNNSLDFSEFDIAI
jgi:hypothetical protein